MEEHESSTSNDGTTDSSTPDTFQPPPAPLPYDVVFGPKSTDSECRRKTVSGSSFETLFTCEDLEESDCKAQANSELVSPKKIKLLKANECHVLMTAEEDEEEEICPICLEGTQCFAANDVFDFSISVVYRIRINGSPLF